MDSEQCKAKSVKKIYIHTFGCKVNQYESQVILEQYQKSGFTPTDDPKQADIMLINSCTVTAQADKQCEQLIRKLIRENPESRVIVSGCYAKRGSEDLKQISDKIEIDIQKSSVEPVITSFYEHTRAFVKIQDGCNSYCSYCIVPYVRPELWSKSRADVLTEIKQLVKSGYPEIVLTGVHIGKYEFGLAGLIEQILEIEGDFRVRVSSVEVGDVDDKFIVLLDKYKNKFCPHLHVPLQSGSGEILKLMNRPYTPDVYKNRIEEIKKAVPEINITTDVIVGFPGETEEQFNQTHNLLNSFAPGKIHIFRYSNRAGTKASKFSGQVNPAVIKQRAGILRQLDEKLQDLYTGKFVDKIRQVIREGQTDYVLTDNYLRLGLAWRDNRKIFQAKILRKEDKYFAEPISG